MSKSIQQLLAYTPLTKALRATSSGVPNPFPKAFFEVRDKNRVMGDRLKYVRITGERRTAKLAKYGSPARRVSLRDFGSQDVRMMFVFDEIQLDLIILAQLQAFEKYQQDEGKDYMQYQFEAAGKRIGNAEVVSVASVLANGALYYDSDGNFLPTSAGAAEIYSFNIPANNQNQLNGIISSSWKYPNADIPGMIRNLQFQSAKDTGHELTTALYGINIPDYLIQNNFALPFLSRNMDYNGKWLSNGEVPPALFGIKNWIPVYKTFFEDQNGVNQSMWPADQITFCPDISQPEAIDNWWAMYEGSYPVPKRLDIPREPSAILNNFTHEYGTFSYGTINTDVPGATVRYGRVWLPGIRNEKAVYQATVAF